MKNPITAQRLSLALSNNNIIPQELANASGVSKASISQYLNGSHAPSNISSGKMARVLKVNPLWLMGFDTPMNIDSQTDSTAPHNGVVINVLGRVSAGIPIEAITDIIDTEEISEKLARTGEFFGLKINGDSMAPDICNNDIVIVRQQDDAETGDIVIATINGDEATCKRLRKYKDGIELIAINPSYDTFEFSNKDICEKPVKIIGKVVESRRKF